MGGDCAIKKHGVSMDKRRVGLLKWRGFFRFRNRTYMIEVVGTFYFRGRVRAEAERFNIAEAGKFLAEASWMTTR